jgi:hypothetical protein
MAKQRGSASLGIGRMNKPKRVQDFERAMERERSSERRVT